MWLGFGVILFAALWGCSDDSPMMSGSGTRPTLLSVSPVDGAINVLPAETIELVFSGPMDTGSVYANFCLLGGEAMLAVMDSLAGMHSSMDYSRMMQWMHGMSVPGHYQWNSGKDRCRFRPDSTLQPNTRHMIFIGRGMMGAGSGMMNENRMMGKDWISHFTMGG